MTLRVELAQDEKEIEQIKKRRKLFVEFLELNDIEPGEAMAMMMAISISIFKKCDMSEEEFLQTMKEAWEYVELV